jgi:hypothetical protein
MRRPTLLVLFAALMVMAMALGASAAFAGEVTGTNDPTPVKAEGTSKSFCAFSGLEDFHNEGDQVMPGVTQNWGQIVKANGPLGGANDTVGPEGPTGCNAVMYPAK